MSIVFALLGAFSQALTCVLQSLASVASTSRKRPALRVAARLISHPLWLFGMATMVGTFVFTALALYFGQIATVQPLLVTELIFTLALRVLWLRDPIAARTWSAAALLCAGLFGFLVVAHPVEGRAQPSPGGWIVAVGLVAVVVIVLLFVDRGASPGRRAGVLGACAGLTWAIDAAFVKAAMQTLGSDGWAGLFTHWPVYPLVATGVLGTVLLQAAFAAGPLASSQSVLLIVDPLASIAIGIWLFHEQLRSSPPAVTAQVLLLGCMSVGVVLLSRWAPPEMEARGGRPPRQAADDDDGGSGEGLVSTSVHDDFGSGSLK